jgi:hypothetical protein
VYHRHTAINHDGSVLDFLPLLLTKGGKPLELNYPNAHAVDLP